MGIPVLLTGLPRVDVNLDRRLVVGGVDLSAPIVTDHGLVAVSGLDIDGWSGAPETTNEFTQKAYRPGAFGSLSPQDKPRTLTVSFTLTAETPAGMREAFDLLNTAAAKTDFPLVYDQWGLRRTVTARRQGAVVETRYAVATVKRWSAVLVAKDPRKYGDPVTLATGLPYITGGMVGPLTGPITSNAQSGTGTVSIDLPGNESAPVRLRIDGPITAPVVTHLGSGLQLAFAPSYRLTADSWLDIDVDARRVLENGQASRERFVVQRGWFTADPGRNDFLFAADTYDPGATLTVTTAPAWE